MRDLPEEEFYIGGAGARLTGRRRRARTCVNREEGVRKPVSPVRIPMESGGGSEICACPLFGILYVRLQCAVKLECGTQRRTAP